MRTIVVLSLFVVVAYAYALNDFDDHEDSPLSLIQQELGETPRRKSDPSTPSSPSSTSSLTSDFASSPKVDHGTSINDLTSPTTDETTAPSTTPAFSGSPTTTPLPAPTVGKEFSSRDEQSSDRSVGEIIRRSDEIKPPEVLDDRNVELLYRHGYNSFRDRSGLLPIDLPFAARLHALLPPVARDEENRSPRPFNFAYVSPTEGGGAHSRSEVADGSGRRVGFYTIRQPDGYVRRVNYIADHNGFRAEVLTNEPGTDNQNTAGAIFRSSAALPFPERLSNPGVPPSSIGPASIPVHSALGGIAHGLPASLAVTPTGLPLSPSEISRPLNPSNYPTAGELEDRYRFPQGSIFPDLRMRYVRIPNGFRAVLVPINS